MATQTPANRLSAPSDEGTDPEWGNGRGLRERSGLWLGGGRTNRMGVPLALASSTLTTGRATDAAQATPSAPDSPRSLPTAWASLDRPARSRRARAAALDPVVGDESVDPRR